MLTLIEGFSVPPEAGPRAGTLYRALREDVDLRYVRVAELGSAGSDVAVYEVVREHRTPDVEGGVVLIEPFDVPEEGEDARFLSSWDGLRDVLERQRGYLGARLYRSIGPSDLRFVEIARWSSPLMFARALRRPGFQALPCDSTPALYQPVA